MNPDPDKERLLAEVFAEPTPGLREAALAETLRLAGGRRLRRRLQRTGAALLVAALAAWLWRPQALPPSLVRQPPVVPRNYELVPNAAFPASALVSSVPLAAEQTVGSHDGVDIVHTTASSGRFEAITDDQLLALVAPRPAALVRVGPAFEHLIFLNPEDEKGFPLN